MRLLVAFDGSEGARAALQEAASLARETGASVVLLQVLNPLLDASDIAAPTTEAAMVTATARAKATLEAALGESGLDAAKAEVVVSTTEHGEDYAEAIEREARESKASSDVPPWFEVRLSNGRVLAIARTREEAKLVPFRFIVLTLDDICDMLRKELDIKTPLGEALYGARVVESTAMSWERPFPAVEPSDIVG